jgi:hypothetical protein
MRRPDTMTKKRVEPIEEQPALDDDTEGQSLSLVLGLDALAGRKQPDQRARHDDERELPPLTKKFPRMAGGHRG